MLPLWPATLILAICWASATGDLRRTLYVLRKQCQREGRDYDTVRETVLVQLPPAKVDRGVQPLVDALE
jgi:hypothetical protein